jgi:hypothetical protein
MTARTDEKRAFQQFRDLLAQHASDYGMHDGANEWFRATQDLLYLSLFHTTAHRLRETRELRWWLGRERGKDAPSPTSPERLVGKNYLTEQELIRLVQAETILFQVSTILISEDLTPTLEQWRLIIQSFLNSYTLALSLLDQNEKED